jgi:hypothetical protein
VGREQLKWGALESEGTMSIHQLLETRAFTPEENTALVSAYEAALAELGVEKTDEKTKQLVGRTVIDVAGQGVRAPDVVCGRAIWALSMERRSHAENPILPAERSDSTALSTMHRHRVARDSSRRGPDGKKTIADDIRSATKSMIVGLSVIFGLTAFLLLGAYGPPRSMTTNSYDITNATTEEPRASPAFRSDLAQ